MISELRSTVRQLQKSPGFTLTALLTLALGIGVNTSMFSVLSTLTLRSVPYPEGDRLVRVYRTSPQSQSWPHSPANFLDYRAQNTLFESVAATRGASYTFSEPGEPAARLRGMEVTADFFTVLGVAPSRGRVFGANEDQPGNNRVAVLSHSAWLNRFNGDTALIGRDIRLNGQPVTVIGIMPPGFEDRQLWGRIELWRPMAWSPSDRETRVANYLGMIARIKADTTLATAQAGADVLAAEFARQHAFMANIGLRLEPLARSAQGETDRKTTWFVVGLAAFVLLIACANLANLQFARAAARARDYAIRSALGASRFRLMRAQLAESLLLGVTGGALGLLVALWTNDLIGRRLIIANQAGIALPLDLRVLGFALLVSVGTGFLFGLLPALYSSQISNLRSQINARGTTASRAQQRLRHGLIVAEVALALMLLAGAGFFVRGLQRFGERDLGWNPDHLLVGYVALNGVKYNTDAKRQAFEESLHARISALPGVRHASISGGLPTWGYTGSANYMVEGRPIPTLGQDTLATVVNVDATYFSTLGIRLVAGRTFDASDRADAPGRTVINESMARALFPNESPLGKRLGSASRPTEPNWREIIGVVADVGLPASLGTPDTRFQTYRVTTQQPIGYLNVVLRTDVAPETLAAELRRAVVALDPDQPIHDIATIRHEIRQMLANVTLIGWLLAGFSVLGVALAALGIYGVISGAVTQRTNEIGVRLALGAQLRDILALVLGQGLRLALLGTALGLAGAFIIARVLRSMAPELPPADLVTAAAITAFLLLTATLASWLPARRATRVNPITALRAE